MDQKEGHGAKQKDKSLGMYVSMMSVSMLGCVTTKVSMCVCVPPPVSPQTASFKLGANGRDWLIG